MLRDQGPRQSIGFGVPPLEVGEERGTSDQSGIARFLDKHPLARFMTTAAASLVSMSVAGSVVKRGGMEAAMRLQKHALSSPNLAGRADQAIKSFRTIESYLDELQGVTRTYRDNDPRNLFERAPGTRRVRRTDETHYNDGYHERPKNRDLPEWAARDEIQRRIVAQARRLPYELPGFYIADKAVLDPLLGSDDRKVDWSSPMDVVGDFAAESLKNIALNVLPFDAATGAAVSKYRQLATRIAQNPTSSPGLASTRFLLEQVGASAADIFNRTQKLSSQSIGAFSAMVHDSIVEGKTMSQLYRGISTGSILPTKPVGNAGYAKRMFQNFRVAAKDEDLRRQMLDALPGPFKGIGSGYKKAKEEFRSIGKAFDDWQDVMSGRTTVDVIKRDSRRWEDLRAFMERGGGTYMERLAKDAANMNKFPAMKGGRVNPLFRDSAFYKDRARMEYQGLYIDSLVEKTGLTYEQAVQFVQKSSRVDVLNRSRADVVSGSNIGERIQFGIGGFHGTSDEWWQNIVRSANAHNIPLGRKTATITNPRQAFEDAVATADMKFSGDYFRRSMDTKIASQWDKIVSGVIPDEAAKTISWIKRPYEDFADTHLKNQKEYLVRRTAQRVGMQVTNNAGVPIPLAQLERGLRDRAIEPTNLHALRGYLIRQKDIAAPWSVGGRNLFGFKPLSIESAMANGYYSAREAPEQEMIKNFIRHKAGSAVDAASDLTGSSSWRMRTGGIFTDSAGNVVDLGRVRRGVTKFIDTLTNETQIPILKFNPLQILGRKAFMAQRNAPTIQMTSPYSLQPFLHGAEGMRGPTTGRPADDFLLWVRSQANKPVGRVFGVRGDRTSGVETTAYQGLYRQLLTNDSTMVGHIARIMAKDMGVPSSDSNLEMLGERLGQERLDPRAARRRSFRARMRDLFDVSYDQENSVFLGEQSWIRRWRGARNQSNSARLANPNLLAQRLADRNLPRLGPDESEGLDALSILLGKMGWSPNALRQITDSPELRQVFDESLGGVNPFNIHDATLPQMAREMLESHATAFRGLTDDTERVAALRSQNALNRLLGQFTSQEGYGDLPVTGGSRTVGVSRRIDELRNSVADYLLASYPARATAFGGTTTTSTSDIVGELFARVQLLKLEGKISARQATESNAAILGLHLTGLRNRAFAETAGDLSDVGYGFGNLDVNQRLFQHLRDAQDEFPEITQALRDVGDYRIGSEGIGGFLGRRLRRAAADVPYKKPYETNPFGADYMLMPTFGSVRDRQGLFGAIRGAATQWSNPETASGMTAVSTHMAARLNRYVETFGLGLDPSRYGGPLDFYARGLIGRRVLPAMVAGSTILAADRTLGGVLQEDQFGNPIYSPFILGGAARAIAEGQVIAAGVTPGGQTAEEKREELFEGEVPIRQGRFWALSNQPWKGGRIQYFRPSWYQRFRAGGTYTPEMNETPLERLAFGYDFSPLRPLDPYRREREDRLTRPYPVSGDYFTGPWGALNPVLNATIGRVLKPERLLHPDATAEMLAQYQPVGQGGAYYGGTASTSSVSAGNALAQINAGYTSGAGTSSGAFYPALGYAAPRGRASDEVRNRASYISQVYSDRAQYPGSYVTTNEMLVPYGVPVQQGYMPPRIVPAGVPLTGISPVRDLGYRVQETLGIYGFGAANIRSALGFGSQDFAPDRAMLEPASRGYSSSRAFWNLNIGGLGDMPLVAESRYSNFEVSEIIRRFVPKDPQGVTYINDLPNLLGQMYPWLPGNEYGLNSVATGDPYNFTDAEIRLPGTGYARTHQLFPDQYGQLGLANIHDILGDVAPWSQQYRQIDSAIDSQGLSPLARAKVSQTRAQVDAMRIKREFTPYEKQGEPWMDTFRDPAASVSGRAWEWLQHRDTFLNSKLMPVRTAVEDWERENVYGATFPSWSSPYESYIQAYLNKSTQRNLPAAISSGAGIGYMFGASARAKALGSIIGGAAGGIASTFGKAYETFTGERYIPEERRQQIALENYADILKYTHAVVNQERAQQQGNFEGAQYFAQQAQQTMYGVDLNSTPEALAMAVPERKREHFRAMLYAPENEREQILSTAGTLERRLFQAAWGMNVERRPDLQEYFQERELPGAESSFWDPTVDMEHVKIKVGQSMGLDMAQMGYYPQQIQEANLVNPTYPDIFESTSSRRTLARIRALLRMQGANGDVVAIPNVFGQDRVELMAGVY
jgi:hypothetical protein